MEGDLEWMTFHGIQKVIFVVIIQTTHYNIMKMKYWECKSTIRKTNKIRNI